MLFIISLIISGCFIIVGEIILHNFVDGLDDSKARTITSAFVSIGILGIFFTCVIHVMLMIL